MGAQLLRNFLDGGSRLAVLASKDRLLLLEIVVILEQQLVGFYQTLAQRDQFANLTLQCRECFIGSLDCHDLEMSVCWNYPLAVSR